MSTTTGIHVTTAPKGTGWVAQTNGVVLSSHRTKTQAVKEARLTAKRHGEQLTVHRKDGSIVEQRSYAISPVAA